MERPETPRALVWCLRFDRAAEDVVPPVDFQLSSGPGRGTTRPGQAGRSAPRVKERVPCLAASTTGIIVGSQRGPGSDSGSFLLPVRMHEVKIRPNCLGSCVFALRSTRADTVY
ncbi:hypothetical protein BRADI_1g46493v3 [Brachypodium distachyon]|uniref:Uncharacterized protein n=1 Tax=Brachypodium distachyon TaxID=15368 RepID=A0A2K2DPN6_BRADI|nr:hypothetical protein BRADI_1g46493v3 [Brachypodium distachyon]